MSFEQVETQAPSSARRTASAARVAVPLGALLAVLTVAVLVYPFPVSGRVWNAIFDLCHAPVFCGLMVVMSLPTALHRTDDVGVRGTKFPRRLVWLTGLAAGMTALGIVGEVLQKFSGRQPSWGDVIANTVGVVSGFLMMASWGPGGRSRRVAGALAALLLVIISVRPAAQIVDSIRQRLAFPELSSFERSGEMGMWAGIQANCVRSGEWASSGRYCLHIAMRPALFSGARMEWPVSNWATYDMLQLTLRNPGTRPLSLILKICDAEHERRGFESSDRYHETLMIGPNEIRTFSIALSAIADAPATRSMDLTEIRSVELFCVDLQSPAVVLLDGLALVSEP